MGKFYLVLLLLVLPLSLIFLRSNQSLLGKATGTGVTVFTTEGSLIKINGAVFNPRGIWNPWVVAEPLNVNQQTLKNVSDSGFNVILVKISPSREVKTVTDVLDAAQQNNLKVILSLQAELFPEQPVPASQALISQALTGVEVVKNHPALMGYLLRDEPDYLDDSTAIFLKEATAKIKQADPNHLTFTDLANCAKASVYKDSADVIMHEHHIYIGPTGLKQPLSQTLSPIDGDYAVEIQKLGEDVACFKKALGNNKPAWAVSFAFGKYNVGKVAELYTPRGPTPAEYESIFYQWFINGATGIIPYAFSMGSGWDWQLQTDSPALWAKMKELNNEQMSFYDALATGDKMIVKVKKPLDTAVQAIVITYNGKTYLMAVNKTPPAVTAQLSTTPFNDKSLFIRLPLATYEGKFMEVTLTPTKPTIKNVKVRQAGNNLVVEWDTDLPSTSQVWYSKNYFTNVPGTFAGAPAITALTTHHVVTVPNLTKGVAYHLRAVSQKDPDDPLTRAISPESLLVIK